MYASKEYSSRTTAAFAAPAGCSFLQRPTLTTSAGARCICIGPNDTLTFRAPSRIYATQATFERPPSSNPRPRYPSRRPEDTSHSSNSSSSSNSSNSSSTYSNNYGAPFKFDPSATYYTECGVCTAVYEIDTAEIGPKGRRVVCEVCGNTWFQRLDRLRVLKPEKKFVEYPVEQKDQLIAKRRDARADYRARRAGSSNEFAVFVGNLPYDADETKLRDLVRDTCEVASIVIVKDRESGRSKGFGFLNVSSDAEVRTLVDKFDGVQFNGRNLTMRAGNRN